MAGKRRPCPYRSYNCKGPDAGRGQNQCKPCYDMVRGPREAAEAARQQERSAQRTQREAAQAQRAAERAEWQAGRDAALAREAAKRDARQAERQSAASGNVKAVYNPEAGTTDNYFGGDKPEGDGKGHGHYTVDETGEGTHPEGGRPAGDRD